MAVPKRSLSRHAAVQRSRTGPRPAAAADMTAMSPVHAMQARLVGPASTGIACEASKYPPAVRLLVPVVASLFCWLGMGLALLY